MQYVHRSGRENAVVYDNSIKRGNRRHLSNKPIAKCADLAIHGDNIFFDQHHYYELIAKTIVFATEALSL